MEDYKRDHADADEHDLQVDVPQAPAAPAADPMHMHMHMLVCRRIKGLEMAHIRDEDITSQDVL